MFRCQGSPAERYPKDSRLKHGPVTDDGWISSATAMLGRENGSPLIASHSIIINQPHGLAEEPAMRA
jgi:hypothetical protein